MRSRQRYRVRAALAAVLALVAVAVCGQPPGALGPFVWEPAIAELDEAMLALCAGRDRLIAVGGEPGRGLVLEWDGSAWVGPGLPAGTDLLWWCWIGDDGAAIAVGEHGTIVRSGAAGTWERDDANAVPDDVALFGVWGSAPDDVFAVGGRADAAGNESLVARYDGVRWTRVEDDAIPGEILFKVWGAGAGDVWVVGTGGAAVRFDGAGWTSHATPTDQGLIAVWGTAPDDVYAVGGAVGAGQVLRYDGSAWSAFASAPERVSGVWTAPGRPLYVAGDRGYVARIDRDDATNSVEAIADPTVDLHSLAARGDLVLACGSDLQSGGDPRWRGAVFTHGGTLAGDVVVPDAGPPPDAAPVYDAGPIGPPDATPLPGPGEECGVAPDLCRAGLDCWGLLTSGVYICTKNCDNASECFEYGDGACCAVPGFQTLETVCIPAGYAECG